MIYEDKRWYGIKLGRGNEGWVSEDDAKLQSPYDLSGVTIVKKRTIHAGTGQPVREHRAS